MSGTWRGFYPKARYIPQGDTYVLIEFSYEHNVFSSLKCLKFWEHLEKASILGIIKGEQTVASRGVSVRYDPKIITIEELISKLREVEEKLPPMEEIEVKSRRIKVPVLFNAKPVRECEDWYSKYIKRKDKYDIDIVVEYNGARSHSELFECFTSQVWWIYFVGFQCGVYCAVPLDPRYYLQAPKYNPPRTWTPEGTICLGNDEAGCYSLRGAGGYQLLGLTPAPIYAYGHGLRPPEKLHPIFRHNPVLHSVGDRVDYVPIDEEQYNEMEKNFEEGKYIYKIIPFESFSVKKYMGFLEEVTPEVENILTRRPWATKEFLAKLLELPWQAKAEVPFRYGSKSEIVS